MSEDQRNQDTEPDCAEQLARERAARAAAETANEAKDLFLSALSHELRTPLNAILGWAHLLRNGKLEGDMATRAAEAIERNARTQARLINDLSDLARAMSGRLQLEAAPVDLASVIGLAVEEARPAAEAQAARLDLKVDPAAGAVTGDATRLQKVVANLLSNAVKFTPGGQITVELRRVEGQAEILVSDTGKGINPELLPDLFDRFRRARSGKRTGGLGLGLTLARHLVELHGGTIHADSAGDGQGATFTVRLPLAGSD